MILLPCHALTGKLLDRPELQDHQSEARGLGPEND